MFCFIIIVVWSNDIIKLHTSRGNMSRTYLVDLVIIIINCTGNPLRMIKYNIVQIQAITINFLMHL